MNAVRKEPMKLTMYCTTIACAALCFGCAASIPPQELNNARHAYYDASDPSSMYLVPINISKARKALARAEEASEDDPNSSRTRALSILAYREAKRAVAVAEAASDSAIDARSHKRLRDTR
jgi:hypothetical protein